MDSKTASDIRQCYLRFLTPYIGQYSLPSYLVIALAEFVVYQQFKNWSEWHPLEFDTINSNNKEDDDSDSLVNEVIKMILIAHEEKLIFNTKYHNLDEESLTDLYNSWIVIKRSINPVITIAIQKFTSFGIIDINTVRIMRQSA